MSAILCNMTDMQWKELSDLILAHTSSPDIVEKVRRNRICSHCLIVCYSDEVQRDQ